MLCFVGNISHDSGLLVMNLFREQLGLFRARVRQKQRAHKGVAAWGSHGERSKGRMLKIPAGAMCGGSYVGIQATLSSLKPGSCTL